MGRVNMRSMSALGAFAVAAALAWPCKAVTISYVGTEPGSSASGFATQNWANPAVPKLYATGTSNEFGKNGYWQIRPTSSSTPNTISAAAGVANDLGTSATPDPTLWQGSNPPFMSSIQGAAGNYVNFGGYSFYFGPDGSTLYRQGALSVSVNQGPFNTPSGTNNGYFGNTLQFALNYAGTVRVGLAVDSVGSGSFAPDYVSIFSTATGTVYSSALTRDATPEMAVFDIVNPAGETFIVAQWQLTGTQNVSAMSLVTFDVIAVPEPSMAAVFASAGVIAAAYRRRRR